MLLPAVVVVEPVAHADVGALVGRGPKLVGLQLPVGCGKGQTVGESQLETHAPAGGAGEIVGEKEVDGIFLIRGQGNVFAVEPHAGVHDGEREPRVGARHKLAVEFEVEARGVARSLVVAVVDRLHVVHRVGHKVGQRLVVGLGRELELAPVHAETVVVAGDEVYRPLAFDVAVECGIGHPAHGRRVAQFLEERRLIVQSRGQPDGHLVAESRYDAQREARTHDGLAVEVPVAHAHAVVECEMRVSART